MIKVDHTVTTNIENGTTIIDSKLPADIPPAFELFRAEAAHRGCFFFNETNENKSVDRFGNVQYNSHTSTKTKQRINVL
jgi:hypothetical protein